MMKKQMEQIDILRTKNNEFRSTNNNSDYQKRFKTKADTLNTATEEQFMDHIKNMAVKGTCKEVHSMNFFIITQTVKPSHATLLA